MTCNKCSSADLAAKSPGGVEYYRCRHDGSPHIGTENCPKDSHPTQGLARRNAPAEGR